MTYSYPFLIKILIQEADLDYFRKPLLLSLGVSVALACNIQFIRETSVLHLKVYVSSVDKSIQLFEFLAEVLKFKGGLVLFKNDLIEGFLEVALFLVHQISFFVGFVLERLTEILHHPLEVELFLSARKLIRDLLVEFFRLEFVAHV